MFYVLLAAVAAVIVILDQVSKALVVANIPLDGYVEAIPGLFHLTYIRNTGAAFSMLEGQRIFFLVITAVFLGGVIYCIVKKVFARPYFWIFAAITGGAIGNLIDRIRFGYVVDMIAVDFIDFAIFNVADIFITCGAVVLVVYALFFDREGKQKKEQTDEGTV
ncbi:MAG: signal peptidase II [Oscillospiraceae bacterium]|nr:signal peptidase II [Oscillospiraceae bacterium]